MNPYEAGNADEFAEPTVVPVHPAGDSQSPNPHNADVGGPTAPVTPLVPSPVAQPLPPAQTVPASQPVVPAQPVASAESIFPVQPTPPVQPAPTVLPTPPAQSTPPTPPEQSVSAPPPAQPASEPVPSAPSDIHRVDAPVAATPQPPVAHHSPVTYPHPYLLRASAYPHPQYPAGYPTPYPGVHHTAYPGVVPHPRPHVHGHHASQQSGQQPSQQPPARRGIGSVVFAALLAAVLASGGTALVMNARDDGNARPSTLAHLSAPTRVDDALLENSTFVNPDWEAVTAVVANSVVSIQIRSAQGGGIGSGFIVDTDGHVLTNNHVIAGAEDGRVQVTLADGRMYHAEIVGTDPTTDLAVVRLQDSPNDLVPVAFGDSSALRVGEPVLAVGNPLGLANTATTGIVSALNRPVQTTGETAEMPVMTNAVQIDAAINPGNSGGPVFNARGQVIGVSSSIAATGAIFGQPGSIGLGFAIPSNQAWNIASQLIENGVAQHAFLGVTTEDSQATADGITRRGARIRDVVPGSPAERAGLRSGDVVWAIDGSTVNGAQSLTAHVREYQAGQPATLTLVRNGQALDVDVVLAVREIDAPVVVPIPDPDDSPEPEAPAEG